MVTREVEVPEGTGLTELIVPNMPARIVNNSLYSESNDGIRVLSTRFRTHQVYEDTREDVRTYNQRLLDFVSRGGTLLVQNNFDVDAFNAGKYTPYPAQLSRQRVSVEEAPVEILAPQSAIFNFPNKITPHDFDGWIQERGVNFMGQWDDKFQPLLVSGDPGEIELKGKGSTPSYLLTGRSTPA